MNFRKLILCALSAMAVLLPASAADQTVWSKATNPKWISNAVIYEANLRQGTAERNLQGLQKRLPELKRLGVDIIWLMPIHPISVKNRKGTLGSYYAVADYKAVNPEFGTFDDLKNFVKAAHKLGMKVILDEVCNHSGCDNPWVTEHPEFYARDEKGDMIGPYDWTDVYKFDYSNPEMRKAMIDALKFWVKKADIDGYRFDVAGEVPTDFWVEARKALQKIKPVLFLAEASKPELMEEAFDVDYAWPMKDLFNAIAATQGINQYATEHNQNLPKANARSIFELIEKQNKEFPKGSIHMNMITNHDLNSWEGTEFDRYGEAAFAFAVLVYTLPGIPMMYTGQEVGWDKAFEFFEHDQTPDYTPNSFTQFYASLNALRHDTQALAELGKKSGTFKPIKTTSPDIIAFERKKGSDRVLVVVNLSNETQPLEFADKKPSLKQMVNFFHPTVSQLPTNLKPWGFVIMRSIPQERSLHLPLGPTTKAGAEEAPTQSQVQSRGTIKKM